MVWSKLLSLPSTRKLNYIRRYLKARDQVTYVHVNFRFLCLSSVSLSCSTTRARAALYRALRFSTFRVLPPLLPPPSTRWFGKLGTRPPPRRDKALRLERGPRLNWKFCVYCIMRSYYVKVYEHTIAGKVNV